MAYGGSIIAGEFEHQTGNLLFPKINRSRLLLGRILGLFLLNSFTIILWYFLIALYIGSHYNWQIPMELGFSLGFAVLFSLTVLSFMISISSWMKSTSGTIIIANFILFFLLGAILIIGMALSTDEQLFNLLYYGYIIANIIQMPEPRYLELITPISPTESLTIRTWLTPSVETAIIGMITHIFIYLLISFIFFQRRQLK